MKKMLFLCISFLFLFITSDIPVQAKSTSGEIREFANVVLFAHFSGDNAEKDAAYFADRDNRDKIINLYNGESKRSVTNYLNSISYGNFKLHNVFPQDNGTSIQSYCLSVSESTAQNENVDYNIIKELIDNVPGVREQAVDYDGDGYVDNITVIMKGGTENETGSNVTLYSHKGNYPAADRWNGKYIGTYNMLSTQRIDDVGSAVITHEFLHSLGYPDLYRGGIDDPNDSSVHPVYLWDIMANAEPRMQYPLAYLRMAITGWLDIDTVTESREKLTLDSQKNADGNQAYILKSPLNEQELFVVEFRKGSNTVGGDELDGAIRENAGGIIVYRVNTTVTGFSNHYGQTGVYVFRPQTGQSGYVEGNEVATVYNAALSEEAGRVTIGSDDMSAGLTDGALTFSNGMNSGIVISNVSSNKGDQMTFDVKIPNASDFDLWEDTNFKNTSNEEYGKNALIASIDNKQYLVANENNIIQMYQYKDENWSAVGNNISEREGALDIKLLSCDDGLYLIYITNSQSLRIKKFSNNTWQDILSKEMMGSEISAECIDGKIYLTYIPDNINAMLGRLENGSIVPVGTYSSADNLSFRGQPKICKLNGDIYVSVKNTNGNIIEVYRYNGGDKFTKISDDSYKGANYDIVSLDQKIYVLIGDSRIQILSYDGAKWTEGKNAEIPVFGPKLAVSQGNLYVIISDPEGKGNTKVYNYDADKDSYEQEGEDVDSAAMNPTFTATENQLFVSYVRNAGSKIVVKTKKTVNELLSLTVVPPNKTSYILGDDIDTSGLTVTANYKKGTKNLSSGVYEISGFDTKTTGEKIATISYGGKSNIFVYEVMEHLTHIWKTDKTIDRQPTCTEPGSKSTHCTICSQTKDSEEIPALGHDYKTTTTKATVTKDGNIVTQCTRCADKSRSMIIYHPKTVRLSGTSYTYNGKIQKPEVSVLDKAGRTINRENYVVTYSPGCKAIGKYTVTVTFKGNYTGTITTTYTITPKGTKISKISAGKKKLTVKWKKQKNQISGYQIQYSTNKNFKSGKKTITLSKKKTSRTLSKLKAKKKYYVRVRTYKNVKVNKKREKIYSGWSKVKSVKVK